MSHIRKLKVGDRIFQAHKENRGTVVWAHGIHVEIRWDSSGETFPYINTNIGNFVQLLPPLEQLAEQAE